MEIALDYLSGEDDLINSNALCFWIAPSKRSEILSIMLAIKVLNVFHYVNPNALSRPEKSPKFARSC